MYIDDWTGQIMCNKRRSELVNFRAEPGLVDILKKMENKAEFIREAIKEKLNKLPKSYCSYGKEKFIYQQGIDSTK